MTKPEGPEQVPQETSDPSWTKWDLAKLAFPHARESVVPATPAPSQRSKQVPERTISDECKYCAEGEPEWSTDASCWIHRRPQLDKRCTRKTLSPIGEWPASSQPAGAREWDDDPTPQELMAAYDRVRKERDELKQQTAAKDAGIRELTFVKDVWVETGENYKMLLEAAERERDSLREANARLAADLNAALKARKDGQK